MTYWSDSRPARVGERILWNLTAIRLDSRCRRMRESNLSFDPLTSACSSKSLPLAPAVTSRLAPIEVPHNGGHGCAMQQDRDEHDECQCTPEEVRRFETALLERVGQVVHGPQTPDAVEADHRPLGIWATGSSKADPAG